MAIEEQFEPSLTLESIEGDVNVESSNVCRAVALGAALSAGDSLADCQDAMEGLGFAWSDLQDLGGWDAVEPRLVGGVDAFSALRNNFDPGAAAALLASYLGSASERVSVAAAAAIFTSQYRSRSGPRFRPPWWWVRKGLPQQMWRRLGFPITLPSGEDSFDQPGYGDPLHWDGREWSDIVGEALSDANLDADVVMDRLLDLSVWRLSLASFSADDIVRDLARASAAAVSDGGGGSDFDNFDHPGSGPRTSVSGPARVSSVIHGTNAWSSGWWRPGDVFHSHVLNGVRSNIYQGGAYYSWSGYLLPGHRKRAALDLRQWTQAMAPAGLDVLFAHSYGGEVAVRYWLRNGIVSRVALLSVPLNPLVQWAINRGMPAADIRLRFDPVLALLGWRQRCPNVQNVTSVVLPFWNLRHGATHDPQVWIKYDVKDQAGL